MRGRGVGGFRHAARSENIHAAAGRVRSRAVHHRGPKITKRRPVHSPRGVRQRGTVRERAGRGVAQRRWWREDEHEKKRRGAVVVYQFLGR